MKSLLAIVGLSLGLVLAVPGHAEPGLDEPSGDENNGSFIADLQKVGIGFSDPAQAVSAGQAVCGCPRTRAWAACTSSSTCRRATRPSPESGAAQFATISAKAYCPKQLEEEHSPGRKYIHGNAPGKGTGDGETTVPKGSGEGGGGGG